MPLDYTKDAVSTWDVITAFETRLKAGMSAVAGGSKPNAGFVRLTTSPDERDGGAYKAEEGLHIVPGDPEPEELDGATRSGKRSRIVFEVWCVTRSNQDRAGDSRIAIQKHVTLQDALFNALDDTPPIGVPNAQLTQVGITCHWIPGGDEIRRKTKIAPDTFVSVHLFRVTYLQKLQVVRRVF